MHIRYRALSRNTFGYLRQFSMLAAAVMVLCSLCWNGARSIREQHRTSLDSLRRLSELAATYHQTGTLDCGISAIGMVLELLCGPNLQRKQALRTEAESLREPLSLLDLRQTASRWETRALPSKHQSLKSLSYPSILHIDGDHFVVALAPNGDLHTVFDPRTGRVLFMDGSGLESRWDGHALEFGVCQP